MGYGSATVEELRRTTNRTLDRPLDKLLNRLFYTTRLTAHALPANIRPVYIVPAHGGLANLVEAMEVETTHRVEALGVGRIG